MTVILFFIGFFLITKGADFFINSTVDVGKKLNVSELILGATIVSFATTLPELTVSTLASIKGHTTMSLGNAVGSIVCNTGLVLGLVSFISPFKVDKKMFLSKSIVLLTSISTLILLGMDKKISRIDGVILLLICIFYMYSNYRSVSNNSVKSQKNNLENQGASFWIKTFIFFFLGLFMMILGSKTLVDNGIKIAEFIGIPQGIISLTVIALGTSLPELVSSLTAIKKNCHSLCVGNVLGANILNIVSVIAISSIPNNIPVLAQSTKIDFPFMIVLLLSLIIPTMFTKKVSRFQGLILLMIYFTYISFLSFIYI